MEGRFITFEGIEGSGKTYQTKRLSDYLIKNDYLVDIVREPGATRVGEQIRKVLLNPDHSELCSYTELLLYYAARAQIVDEKIMPALASDRIVLCDRFYDSSRAYQQYGRGLDKKLLDVLDENFVKVHPALTILIDIPVDVGLARRGKETGEFGKLDRLEAEAHEFHQRVRHGYLELFGGSKGRIKAVDGSASKEHVFSSIACIVNEFLGH
jgi:dTMP kinase